MDMLINILEQKQLPIWYLIMTTTTLQNIGLDIFVKISFIGIQNWDYRIPKSSA